MKYKKVKPKNYTPPADPTLDEFTDAEIDAAILAAITAPMKAKDVVSAVEQTLLFDSGKNGYAHPHHTRIEDRIDALVDSGDIEDGK